MFFDRNRLRLVFLSGDWIPVTLPDTIKTAFPGTRVIGLGGATEATVWSNYYPIEEVDPRWVSIPYGKPIQNAKYYILDQHLNPCPIGIRGALYIGGDCLASGYNDPLQTTQRFIPDPFSEDGNARLYHTGDLARYLPDGNMEFLGRMDNQVKIRGFRIELGEIEAVLANHPSVQQAVVIGWEVKPGDKRLVAYLVAQGETAPTPKELRHFLGERLPDYMLPARFIGLEKFPLTPNGKIDRHHLPTPDPFERTTDEEPVAPHTPIEEILTAIWTEVLEVEQIGIHDNFFALGGDSLLLIQVISRARESLGVKLSPHGLFEYPTIAELARHMETSRWHEPDLHHSPLIRVPSREQNLPLSYFQEQLWFLARLHPDVPFYNESATIHMDGELDVAALERAIHAIIERHETLRTTFAMVDGQAVQRIMRPPMPPLPIVDLGALPPEQREALARQRATEEAKRPFDLTRDTLPRVGLVKMGKTEYRLFLTVHHIAIDGVSLTIFLKELAALYKAFSTGRPSPLPALPIRYADFAYWQRQRLPEEVFETQLSYWKRIFGDDPPVLGVCRAYGDRSEKVRNRGHFFANSRRNSELFNENSRKQWTDLSLLQPIHPKSDRLLGLPTDRPRPAVPTFRGAKQYLALSEGLTEEIKMLSQQEGVTLFMTLLAAFKTLLYRYTGQDEIVVGTVADIRDRPELEHLIGYFLNTLVLCTELSGTPTFRQCLGRVREVTLGAMAHRDLPFEKLVNALHPERNMGKNPLFQVAFILDPPMPDMDSGWTLTQWDIDNGTAKFDLYLGLEEKPEGIGGYIQYSTDLFDAPTISRMIGHFRTLLEGIVANPGQRISRLPLLTEPERHRLLEWNDTATDYPRNACIHGLFEARAETTPQAVAVVFEDQSLTYAALNQKANGLAHYLQTLGVKPGVLVGICIERSLEMVIGLLGILKAGGAYLPLDPAYPTERLGFMLEDARVPVLLTQTSLIASLPETTASVVCIDAEEERLSESSAGNRASGNPTSDVQPDDPAYVIYTSGSTGKPKGVMIHHRSLVNFLVSLGQQPGLTARDTLLAVTTLSFDIAALELYLPLIRGAKVVLASRETAADGLRLSERLDRSEITILQATPATWQLLLRVGWKGKRDLTMLCGGEALPSELARQLLEKGRSLWNLYGPTETTIWSTRHRVRPEDGTDHTIPIGYPIANTEIHILDRDLQPVPVGIPGELYIGGAGLARGYLDRPELTAEKFVEIQLFGKTRRVYKTGDLACYLPEGNIAYLGRLDNQVKIRGFRIELGEIEAALGQHARETAVVVHETAQIGKRLVAYLVPHPGQDLDPVELRRVLTEKLPEYMVPSAFVALEALPLTPNGKVDRRALSRLSVEREIAEKHFVAPRTPGEERLAGIWAKLLGIETVGIHDNFFDLGGHSLTLAGMVALVQDAFRIDFPLELAFRFPTLGALAEQIENVCAREETTDTAQDAIDLHGEATLPAKISPTFDPAITGKAPPVTPGTLLLTGASGFLGTHMLAGLIRRYPETNILCMVRGRDHREAHARLVAGMRFYGVWQEYFRTGKTKILAEPVAEPRSTPFESGREALIHSEGHFHVLIGDLTRPGFGWSPARFDALAAEVDTIYHNGAWVNALYPYTDLRPTNVFGTRELLRLACLGRPKIFHHISTMSVFEGELKHQARNHYRAVLPAAGLTDHYQEIKTDYGKSKWVAEKLVQTARERGLSVCIYRPTVVMGDRSTGRGNTFDLLALCLRRFVQSGVWPSDKTFYHIASVDRMVEVILDLAGQPASVGHNFNLSPRRGETSDVLLAWLRSAGHKMTELPYAKLKAHALENHISALLPLLPYLDRVFEIPGMDWRHEFDQRNVEAGLGHPPAVFPEIDRDYFLLCMDDILRASDDIRDPRPRYSD
uniref:Amino acid adenylation domain-containing protein/thioester reductase domain-containing protein n=2 Tax=Candidatus Kentrum sp. FM TaxID=2126340 RepID=A0A450SKJ7_9GAMM|nr:MAG: amino acid adenylation domain-containing protein/thioester reductase domain-containing protein [Candidatus Kentron sp. FM]